MQIEFEHLSEQQQEAHRQQLVVEPQEDQLMLSVDDLATTLETATQVTEEEISSKESASVPISLPRLKIKPEQIFSEERAPKGSPICPPSKGFRNSIICNVALKAADFKYMSVSCRLLPFSFTSGTSQIVEETFTPSYRIQPIVNASELASPSSCINLSTFRKINISKRVAYVSLLEKSKNFLRVY